MYSKNINKIIFGFLIFSIFNTSIANNYDLYKERIGIIEGKNTICKEYNPSGNTEKILKNEPIFVNPYENSNTSTGIIENRDDYLIIAKGVYKENMNNIYKCALLNTQIKELRNIKKLIKIDKTGEIGKNISQKIDNKINKLQAIAKNDNGSGACNISQDGKNISKENVLKNASYETCKYVSYLDFLRSYYNDIRVLNYNNVGENVGNTDSQISTVAGLSNIFTKKQNDIDTEEAHAINTFSIAFGAYNEYEYNYPLHILLNLIKEDLIIFRDKLHAAINPINQVVYKISNAMSGN